MDQSRATGISLQELNRTGLEERPRQNQNDISANASETDIMQQSLLADSQVPDGGEAWVVISGCAVVTWWFIGTSYCWGILQAALVKEGVSSSSTLAFVGSLATACISFLGILNARVIRKLGTRYSAMAGVFFLGLGEVLSGFSAMSIGGLFATAGVVMGIGIRYARVRTQISVCHANLLLVFVSWLSPSRRRSISGRSAASLMELCMRLVVLVVL